MFVLSGTIMMSGCGILTNGKGTRREYGQFNLDELTVGFGLNGFICLRLRSPRMDACVKFTMWID